MDRTICSVRNDNRYKYPSVCPYDPDSGYPEFSNEFSYEGNNYVFDAVRHCLIDLGLDIFNVGESTWNPFKNLVKPGDVVVIKPNLVFNTPNKDRQICTTTHASVIRPVIDYVWKALNQKGKIIIGDACAAETDFCEVIHRSHIDEMVEVLIKRGINIEIQDFRSVKVTQENGIWTGEQENETKACSIIVDLGRESLFYGNKGTKYHGAGYNIKATTKHHSNDRQEYCVSKAILEADVVISIPKFKTHRKAGITCCLKNLVGINTDKNYLPHFAMGSANMGGDEMPSIQKTRIPLLMIYDWFRENILAYTWRYIGGVSTKLLNIVFKNNTEKNKNCSDLNTIDEVDTAGMLHTKITGQVISSGAWQGNQTICKMILDLNKIFLCCDKEGRYASETDRKYFYLVDGIEIGMGDGPVNPIPLHSGFIAAGFNGFTIDCTLLSLFDIKPNAIPLYAMAEENTWIKETGFVTFNGKKINDDTVFKCGKLTPPKGWNYYENQ